MIKKRHINHKADLVVLGAGPGGYTAAFRAADLGMDVTLIERRPVLGGVCLNAGCIPSKALLHAARVIEEANAMKEHGINFSKPRINLKKLKGWKNNIVSKLNSGLEELSKQRKVKILRGTGFFQSSNRIVLENKESIDFEKCIIAVGSENALLPGMPEDVRILDSTKALDLEKIPKSLLVIGGGIIGLEMACVYNALGSKVTVAELTETLMPGTDKDLVSTYSRYIGRRYDDIFLNTKVSKIESKKSGLKVFFEGKECPSSKVFDNILIAIGRQSNGNNIGLGNAGVNVDKHGIVNVDKQMQTMSRIFLL